MAGPVAVAASLPWMVQFNAAREIVSLHQGRHLRTAQQAVKIDIPMLWQFSNPFWLNLNITTADAALDGYRLTPLQW